MPNTYFCLDEAQVARLRAVATRLYSERRMDGDAMRDAAHTITAVLDGALPYEYPERS